ncbi:L-asparaginase II [Thozetella sp. PMI_491]|nr:L-asparaginase II [Thozetella sp. PMI_491]
MITEAPYDDYVASYRSGIVENMHKVHCAVIDATGKLLFTVGNPSRVTLIRSAAKPFQALALLETNGFDKYAFDDADLALICASHNAEERHITRSRAMLAQLDANEQDLRCGGHPSISETLNREWIRRDFTPGPVYNNCSGKHAAMLAGAHLFSTANVAEYHLPSHPIQQQVKAVFEVVSGLDAAQVQWGIDGCNLPAPALPLRGLASMYASLAQAADNSEKEDISPPDRQRHLSRIFGSMSRYPEMVGGENRFCTELMRGFRGRVVGKVGADGCYGVAVRAGEDTRQLGAKGAIGIAVKIEDGNLEVLYAAVAEILEQLAIGEPEVRAKFTQFHHLKRANTAGVIIGDFSFAFKLRTA